MGAEIAGLLGTLIGGLVSIGTTFLSNRHARSLQTSADAIVREERAREFQRDNLLKCQEQMQATARLTGKANYEDTMAFRAGKPWKEIYLSEPLNSDLADCARRFSALVERVADDELRTALKAIGMEMTMVINSGSPVEADAALKRAIDAYQLTMVQLGEVLRKTY